MRLVDFGLAAEVSSEADLRTRVGTSFYVAPEVLEGKYNVKCDMWSVGVITYTMLCGYPPFHGDNNNEVFKKILNCELVFFENDWKNISREAVHFISKLIVEDPETRLSATDALKHPWMLMGDQSKGLCPGVLKRLRLFRQP